MGWRDDLRAAAQMGAGFLGNQLLKAAQAEDGTVQEEETDRGPGGDNQDSAANAPVPSDPAKQDPKSLFYDPFAVIEQLGYKEKYSQLTYGTLKAMVWKTPVVQAILQTRINQIAAFAQPQADRYNLGYQIKLRDSEKQPTKIEKDWAKQMSMLVQRTGVTENPRGRDTFETFLKKLTWDSLCYDQLCFEVVPNREGQPAEWYAIDGSTIRLADSNTLHYNEDDAEKIRYVQVYDSQIIAEYNQQELCFGVRNPRTDIRNYGYGTSELEMLISTITSMLWALEYNQKFFTQGSAPKGILNFKGAIPENQMSSFRRHWAAHMQSISNSWRQPITNADELQWIDLHSSNKDMEHSAYLDFLIKLTCSIYAMDPLEVNFKYGNSGQKSGLQEASNKEKITESKERGLRPLLRHIESCLNHYIVWPTNENFEFKFVGLDAATRDDVSKLNQSRVKTTWTVNELRAEEDMPPLPDGLGDVILDPTWMQLKQAQDGMAMEAEQGEGGFPGDEGGDEGDEDFDFESLLADEDEGGEDDAEDDNKPAQPVREVGQKDRDEAEKSLKIAVRL
jgi:hypothetical protein